jgi:hypothetical protein
VALNSAAAKVDEYYNKTIQTRMYIMTMHTFIIFSLLLSGISYLIDVVLDPASKMAYFEKCWPTHLHGKILTCAENIVHVFFHLFEAMINLYYITSLRIATLH